MRLALALAAAVCAVILAVWAWLGAPVPPPAASFSAAEKIPCVSYAPFRADQSPFIAGLVIPPEQIDDDFARLAKITDCVRTYSTEMGLSAAPALARKHGLSMLQGIWIGRDPANNRIEIEEALKAAKANPDVIKGLIVGNEVLLRGEQTPAAMAALIAEVKSRAGGIPVTYADVWEFWERNVALADGVDFVTVHILPFWEDLPVGADKAVAHIDEIRQHVGKIFAGKEILIGETGWPSAGRMREGAQPSPSNQARVIEELLALAKEKGYRVNVIEAFDQPWKRQLEGTVGGRWGFLDAYTRDFKFHWGVPTSDHPRWLVDALAGIALALGCFGMAQWGAKRAGAAPPATAGWIAVAAVALFAGLTYGRALASAPVESLGVAGWTRALIMLAIGLAVPLLVSFAIGGRARTVGLATALDPQMRRGASGLDVALGVLLAASVVLIAQIGFGLVFDPRYKDFQFAGLTPIVAAFLVYAFTVDRGSAGEGNAERIAGTAFIASGLYVVLNETLANWQGLWTGSLMVLFGISLWRLARAARRI
ncbi:glycoside hydrolase family 17 protein [Ancylobacter terrae]|uniref:glycoside hydrolase family 17 protein n=1 Tax=Ancylobacter sp. sgz301288 TaxID=3342077 RepID=UPI00385DC0C8